MIYAFSPSSEGRIESFFTLIYEVSFVVLEIAKMQNELTLISSDPCRPDVSQLLINSEKYYRLLNIAHSDISLNRFCAK